MDQGLKERLVGAAVLVAIGVWLIPWVLDGPENTVETGTASLVLPAAEQPLPMRTQTLRIGEPETTPPAEPDTVVAAAGPAAAEPETAAAPPAAEPAAPPPTVTAAAEKTAAAEPPAAEPPAAKPAPAPAAAAKPAAAPAAKGDWVVQLGSFGEEANARRLAQRVATFGYKPVVSSYRTGGKTLYRVRLGPYEAKGQADATASALAAHSFVAKVVPAN
jgi:DedD protein